MMAAESRADRHTRRLAHAAFALGETTAAELAAELGSAAPAAPAIDDARLLAAAAARGLGPLEAAALLAVAHLADAGLAAPPPAVAAALHVGEPEAVRVVIALLRRAMLVHATQDVGVGVVPAFTVTPGGAALAAELRAAGEGRS